MLNEGTEWEEKRTWIPLERNLEMQEKKEKTFVLTLSAVLKMSRQMLRIETMNVELTF